MRFVKLRAGHACTNRSPAIVMGDEPNQYRPFAEVPACGNKDLTNAYADLFAAAPGLFQALATLIDRADDLIAAIDGATDQFAEEVAGLSAAATAAEALCSPLRRPT